MKSFLRLSIFSLLSLLTMSSIQAAKKKDADTTKVIDLGESEVKGSVRKPLLRVVETQATVTALLPELYRRQFEAMEARYLKAQPLVTTGDTRGQPRR